MMSEYKKYDEYKDSGVEWIGEIPEEWDTVKTSYLFKDIGSGTTPKSDKLIYYNGDINWLITGDLNDGYIYRTKKTITKKALLDHSTLKIYPKNSIVIAMYGATIGKLGILADEMATNQACCILSGVENGDPRYYFYWFLANRDYLVSLAQGGGQKNINQDLIKNFITLKPTNKDIKKIASFLDKRTAEIDKIINKKETLIDYLEKYKKTVITEAVTRGKLGDKYINENGDLVDEIEMKDSGTQFYGNIPKHLIIKKMKYITKAIIDGAHLTPTYVDDGVPFLRVTDISEGNDIDWKNTKQIPLNEHKQLKARTNPEKGDLLVSKNGTIGKTLVITWDKEFSIFVSLCLLKFVKEIDPFYIAYFFKSYALDEQIKLSGKTNTITNLHLEKIRELELLIPEQDKLQKKIVNYLDQQNIRINNLIQKTKQSIEKYKEYKKSLIFEAVTGKIDLRDYKLEGGEELAEHNNSSETERECISAVD